MQLTIGWLQLGRTYFILFVYIQNSGFAKTVKAFEVKLDRFWCEQELKYNYRATIATGPDPHKVEIHEKSWCHRLIAFYRNEILDVRILSIGTNVCS